MITDIEYGLLPCPICGKRFRRSNLHFYNDEGELIGDMESATDLDNITDPCNAVSYEVMKSMTKLDLQQAVGVFLDCIDEVSTVAVVCECGYGMSFDRWKSDYPDQGWFMEFEGAVNRRSVKAMETTLKHIIDHACGGPLRQRYQDALSAIQSVRRMQEGQEEFERMMEGRQ